MDATIVFLEQCGNRINSLVRFTKHRQLAYHIGDNSTLSIVEQKSMAPRTVGGLAHGMAYGGHIRHKNNEFIGIEGPTPASTFGRSLDLRPGDLDPTVYDGRTLRTALSGSIPEYTYIGGPYPHSSPTMAMPSFSTSIPLSILHQV